MSNPHYGGQFGQPGNTGQFQGQVPQPSQQFQGQMPQQAGFNGQMPQAPRKKNNKATALIAAIIAAVLVIIGGGAFALSRSLSASGGFASPTALANSINSAFGSNKLTSLDGPVALGAEGSNDLAEGLQGQRQGRLVEAGESRGIGRLHRPDRPQQVHHRVYG